MKFSELTEQQQLVIHPIWRRENPNALLEEIDGACPTELWQCFLEAENDPDAVIELYRALFEPYHIAIYDELWRIHKPNEYKQVLVLTGRLDELLAPP
jgi:hypothetical protein